MLLLVLVQFLVVLLRYVFDLGFVWMQEALLYGHGLAALLPIGFTLWAGGHVRVDMFYRSANERHQAWVDLIGSLLFLLPVAVLVFWTSLPFVLASWAVHEGSAQPAGIHAVFLLKSVLPVFAGLLGLQGVERLVRAGRVLWRVQSVDPGLGGYSGGKPEA
ncbi:TRAP transporter small permease subunit [Roseibium algae]|uniref:TRAP transporter small permease protein n=1 Tax=Roseibium algae TaxID=3123038 RepID=A0ABU8TG50_9HYPH